MARLLGETAKLQSFVGAMHLKPPSTAARSINKPLIQQGRPHQLRYYEAQFPIPRYDATAELVMS